MIDSIIETVNSLNGGPVTEGKVMDLIRRERETTIRADIDVVAARVDRLVEEEVAKVARVV